MSSDARVDTADMRVRSMPAGKEDRNALRMLSEQKEKNMIWNLMHKLLGALPLSEGLAESYQNVWQSFLAGRPEDHIVSSWDVPMIAPTLGIATPRRVFAPAFLDIWEQTVPKHWTGRCGLWKMGKKD